MFCDVLDAHHPGADHAVADRWSSLHSWRPAKRIARRRPEPGRCREGHRMHRWLPYAVVDALDVSALRLFLAVVELGSVSKAAMRHGLAQPSATAKLQKLERQLGVQLLDRGPSGSVATAAGVRLAPACAELVGRRRRRSIARGDELSRRAAAARRSPPPATSPTTSSRAGSAAPALAGRARRSDRGRHPAPSPRPCAPARPTLGFTDGPAAPLGLRSELVATEEIVAVVGRRHPWFDRRRAVSGRDAGRRRRSSLAAPRLGHARRDRARRSPPHGLSAHGDRIEVAGRRRGAAGRAQRCRRSRSCPRCRVAGDLAVRSARRRCRLRDLPDRAARARRVARRPSGRAPRPPPTRRRPPRCDEQSTRVVDLHTQLGPIGSLAHQTTVSNAFLDAAGVSETQRRRLVRTGQLVRIVDGGYQFAGIGATELARCAALCASHPTLVIAGPTAGRIHRKSSQPPR